MSAAGHFASLLRELPDRGRPEAARGVFAQFECSVAIASFSFLACWQPVLMEVSTNLRPEVCSAPFQRGWEQ